MERDELKIISHHIFLYPFRWDFVPNGKKMDELNFDSRTDFKNWKALFKDHRHWKSQDFIIGGRDAAKDYNEFTFFYDFVRKSIYNFESEEEKSHRMLFYDYSLGPEATFTIQTTKDKFVLTLSDINLHIFDTGIGILTFHLLNYKNNNKEDILKINEYGRRIYPQFLGRNLEKDTQNSFLASQISLNIGVGSHSFEEDFSFYGNGLNLRKQPPVKLPQYIQSLFDGIPIGLEREGQRDFIRLVGIMDDRMFTICWYGNDHLAEALVPNDNYYPHKKSDWWYAYTFVDKSSYSITCQNQEEKTSYINNHTYARWANYGTYYGLSRETFMVLSSSKKKCLDNYAPPLWDHITTMYYQIVILCLTQRASILRFSGEVSRMASMLKNDGREMVSAKDIKNLYINYIEFVNKIYFREVTAQVQAIELYEMLQKHMNIERDVKALAGEIDDLQKYLVLEEQERNNDKLEKLTLLGGLFLLPSLLFGFLGMNMFEKEDFVNSTSNKDPISLGNLQVLISLLSAILFIVGLVYTVHIVSQVQTKKRQNSIILLFSLIFALIAFACYIAIFMKWLYRS